MSLRIGFLLNTYVVPAWQKQIISFVHGDPDCHIACVILNNSTFRSSKPNRIVYRTLRRIDRQLFKVKHDCFVPENTETFFEQVDKINVTPVETRFTCAISDEDIAKIRAQKIDILIRFGFGILKGEILNVARLGVWSLHHGDNEINRGGPPGFWEVVRREPVTGVTLQILSGELDGGEVLEKAFSRTDTTSFNRNQNAVFAAGVELFCSTIRKVGSQGLSRFQKPGFERVGFYSHALYRDPGTVRSLVTFISFWLGRIWSIVSKLWRYEQWTLLYRFTDRGAFDKTIYRYKRVKTPARTDWADPFVIFHERKYYIFFEQLRHGSGKASIGCLLFDDKGKPLGKEAVTVLNEPHHLSYPFVFASDGKFYMIPEAASTGAVWLYECTTFPTQWKRTRKLLDEGLYDPTIFQHGAAWYLFGTKKPSPASSPHQYLFIYYTTNLFHGEWIPHPCNPVKRDVRGARPAGKLFMHNGKILRPAQVGAPRYGYALRLYEIVELTPTSFHEVPVEDIVPEWSDDVLGIHTFNFDHGFSVIDAQVKRRRFV